MAFHGGEFSRQSVEDWIAGELSYAVRAALENARRVIAARPRPRMADMRVDGSLRRERVPAVRTIPRAVDADFSENGEPLRPAAGGPDRKSSLLENFLGAAPRLPRDHQSLKLPERNAHNGFGSGSTKDL